MQPPVFYADPATITPESVVLSKTESHHASRVLRLTRGDLVIVVDGLGGAYRGEVLKVGRTVGMEIRFHSHVRNFGEPNVVVTLAAGLSVGYKFETVVEKGTELGVKRFVPLITEKSKVRLEDPRKAMTKVRRYEKVAMSAMKQCRRAYRPEISAPVTFEGYLKEIDGDSTNLLFHPTDSSEAYGDLKLTPDVKRISIIVGSESGFSSAEVNMAAQQGAKIVSLGRRILRTETAGPVICALVMNSLGELR